MSTPNETDDIIDDPTVFKPKNKSTGAEIDYENFRNLEYKPTWFAFEPVRMTFPSNVQHVCKHDKKQERYRRNKK